MSMKDLRPLMVQTFCAIIAIIVIGKFIMDTFFAALLVRDFQAGDAAQMLLMGIIGSLSFLIFYSKQELSRKQMFVRVGMHILLTTPILWYLYGKWEWIPLDTLEGIIAATVICVISYIVLFGGIFLKELNEASKMNSALEKKRKEKQERATKEW